MPHVRSGEISLWYETFGSGEPLLMLMGLGGTIQAWGLQIPTLSRHFRLICPDNRGAGRSDKPPGPYSMAQFMDDVSAVLDAEGIDSAHILGASMGGLIAQEYCLRHPRRVRSLVLACTGPGFSDPARTPASPEALAPILMDRRQATQEQVVEALMEVFYHPDYLARIPDLAQKLLKIERANPQPVHAFEAQLQAILAQEPLSPRLGGVRAPTLVLHGEHDQVWPLGNARALAEHIAGAKLVVIPGSAHMFLIEKPHEFNQAVLDFLGAQQGS